MGTNVERKFVSLRKRLDQFGYRQPLGIESLPLVDKLFSDLIYTTENFRKAKLSVGKTEKDSRNVDALLEPYKTENARLVRENNELHQGLLKLTEEKERVTRELKAYVRKLDHDSSDLKFLNNQYVHKVRCLEKDSKVKSERIQQLQEKNMQAVIATPGGKKHSIAFRRQRMQIDGLVPPSENSAYPVPQPDDPYIADLLQMADGRIQELQDDVIKVKLDVERAEECVKHLNTQVEERDKEIERLNRALDGGRPHDVISLEAQTVSNEKLIAHLNLQIEYLQEANRTLEKQVEGLLQKKKDASSEVADLSVKNQELCEELTHIDHLAKQMEMDREQVLETADVELLEARKEIQRLRQATEDLEDIITKLRREQSEGDYEKDRLRDQLAQVKEQQEKMEGLMNFLEEEKRRLQDKVEKMTAADRELVLELEAMRVKYGVCGRERSPSRLDAFVRSLEEERDYYRHEADRYKSARGPGGLDGSPTRTPTRGRSPRTRGDVVEKELARVVRERDELRVALLSFERQMEDIQTNVKSLTAERDQLRAQHTRMQDELTQACSSAEHDDMVRLKEEKEQAARELQQVTSERNALREHLKDSIEGNAESKELEETVRSLSEDIKKANEIIKKLLGENKEMARKNSLRNAVSVSQEKVLHETEETLKAEMEEMVQQRAEVNALRLLQEQMERSLCDTQHRLSVKNSELQAACQQIHKLEERIGELSIQGSEHREKASSMQRSIVTLDKDKDTLQDEVDHKTERLAELQQELNKKEKTIEEVRITVTNLDNSLDQLKGTLSSRDREVGSLRRQLDTAQEELARLTRDRDVARTENRRLQDDLATMTRENQAVHAEMDEALHEKDELKARVHSYIIEVARIEKLMALKEQENRDMLERFRLAHSEVEERGQQLHQAEGLNNSIRLELLSSDSERRRLREATGNQERELQQHIQALQAYEAQVSSLVRARSRLEEETQAARRAEASALADLASVRELCVKLDSGKELTVRQLTSKSMELERLSGELDDVCSEADLLKKQLASERVTVRNLEALLSTNRQKEFQTHLSASERESELKILRDRLVLADSKTGSHAKEVSQLRGKVSQLQTEMDVLKRQLTTERFERERAIQEMRKQGVSFSSLRSSSPLSVSLSPRPISQEPSILRTPDRSTDKSTEKNVSFKE